MRILKTLMISVLVLAACPAMAADAFNFPLTEADYLKAEQKSFEANDRNGDKVLDRNEFIATMGKDGDQVIYLSAGTREACQKAGQNIEAQFKANPPQGADKPIPEKDFLEMHQAMFKHYDRNGDHVITREEAEKTDQEMAGMCAVAPAMLQQVRALQQGALKGAMQSGKVDMQALRKQQEELVKSLKSMPEAGE